MNKLETRKISEVPHGSTITFEHEGKRITGHNWNKEKGSKTIFNVYVLEPPMKNRTIELPHDKEVEVIQFGGFELDIQQDAEISF